MLLLCRGCLQRLPTTISVYSSSCRYLTSPSFTTEPKGDGYKMLSWGGAVSLILSGQPNLPAQTKQFNLDIDTFFEGSRHAVQCISENIRTRNLDGLSSLVSKECLEDLRLNVFESLPASQINQIRVNSDDIFFQYIESAKIIDNTSSMSVVALSLPRLAECKSIKRRMRSFQNNLFTQASKTEGVLRKEDVNAAEFRKIRQEMEELNIEKLAKEGEILISTYNFQRTSNNADWTVTSISHTDSSSIWSYYRRLIWKGRVHISVMYSMDFRTVLRYDYMFDCVVAVILVYLQILALVLGYKMDQEAERRRELGID